jgi:DNA-directed RNA polymerase subunit K/omega
MESGTVNEKYLSRALEVVGDRPILINGASRRASELARGAKPLIKVLPTDDRSYLDIALLEIAEGKLILSVEEED